MADKCEGRIIRSISGFYDVQLPGQVITCRARGILRREGNSPLTGDLVTISREKDKGMVEEILPRRNSFIRPAVANVDALVVFAANVNPVTEPFLIDRVAAIAGEQNVPVYLCINKCDLDPALDLQRIYEHAGFPVICTSAETGEGVEQLRSLLRGKLTAFTGNTGVGKSSILNRLAPELHLATGEVSEKLGRGRHTTRHVELFRLSCGALAADTPSHTMPAPTSPHGSSANISWAKKSPTPTPGAPTPSCSATTPKSSSNHPSITAQVKSPIQFHSTHDKSCPFAVTL